MENLSSGSAQGRIIIVCGPPGAGKGVQCKILESELGFLHLSTGDIFRDAVARGTSLGLEADRYIRRGHFVPDNLVLNMVVDRLRQADAIARCVLLDGFPRTERQAISLLRDFKVERVLLFQISENMCTERVLNRRVDPSTGSIYHLQFMPPPDGEVASRLVRREYDIDRKIVQARLQTYYAHLGLILKHFHGYIQTVNASLSPTEVHSLVMSRIGENLVAPDPLPLPAPPSSAGPVHPAPAKQLCTVCMDSEADSLVVPCGHQCACNACLTAVRGSSGNCPICRQPIEGVVKVFAAGFDGEPVPAASDSADNSSSLLLLQMEADAGGWGPPPSAPSAAAADEKREGPFHVTVDVAPLEDLTGAAGGVHNFAVMVSAPPLTSREPVDICCVVDVSGSMDDPASYEDEKGNKKDDGLTMLDIVKHAVKAVMLMLTESDRLSIVAFSDKGKSVFALGEMNAGGRAQAMEALEMLRADGSTNIWSGLQVGMDSLRENTTCGMSRRKSILLLTDGQPSVSPPRGHAAELKNYLERYPGFHFQLNTFGFGYKLDSKLLHELAVEGKGTFAFIPDSLIVGTAFVNCIANAVCTFTQSATLHILPLGGSEYKGSAAGGLPDIATDWGHTVQLGPLLWGQTREVVVSLSLPPEASPYLEAVVVWPSGDGEGEERAASVASSRSCTVSALSAYSRSLVVDAASSAIRDAGAGKGSEASQHMLAVAGRVAELTARIAAMNGGPDPMAEGILSDVSNRMVKALSTSERFNRWGKHFLRAISRSHQLQQCTNFMDKGLQQYGSACFRDLVEAGGRAFLSLPAPVHSERAAARTASSAASAGPRPASPAMNTYYAGSGGGCFGAASTVSVMTKGGMKKVTKMCDIRPGDIVEARNGGTAAVRCVVKILGKKPLTVLKESGLSITARHPIYIAGKWVLPADIEEDSKDEIWEMEVYNLVLTSEHVLRVNGVDCVTLGHGLADPVTKDDFYGTSEVIRTLASLEGWESGYVTVMSSLKSFQNKRQGGMDTPSKGSDGVYCRSGSNNIDQELEVVPVFRF
jgi:adenylate kinase